MSLLEVKNLTKLCSDCFGIDDISFTVNEKGVYGFFGKSGCGKSVLASVLGGMSDADSGEVLYKELDLLASEKQAAKIKRKIGVVCPVEWFDEDMSVRETLALTGSAKGVDPDKLARQIKEALTLTGIEKKADVLVENLTRAEKKRMAYANALIGNPDTIIIDEPYSSAEASVGESAKQIIEMLGKMKVVLLFSKSPEAFEELCHYVGVISAGKLLAFESLADMYAKLNESVLGLLRVKENKASRDDILSALSSVENVSSAKFSSRTTNIAEYTVECTKKDGVSASISAKLEAVGADFVSFKFTSCSISTVIDALCVENVGEA